MAPSTQSSPRSSTSASSSPSPPPSQFIIRSTHEQHQHQEQQHPLEQHDHQQQQEQYDTSPMSPMSPPRTPESPPSAMTSSRVFTTSNGTPMTIRSDASSPYAFHFDFQSPVAHVRHAQSPFMLATPASKKHAALAMPVSCTFEALSLHFHLPLKVAAEKFGVRATAFKKRCRAIGIRHWPYRKVRSLKRTLQDLARCKDEGPLTDKQTQQLAAYQAQLDKLLSPESYGIDPSSGRLLAHFHTHNNNDDDDDIDSEDDCEDCASSCGSHNSSPRIGSPYSSCSNARSPPPYKIRNAMRSTRGRGGSMSGTNNNSHPAGTHYFYNMVHSNNNSTSMDYTDAPTLNESATMPSVSVRFATHSSHASAGLPFEAYDPFFSDFKSEYSLTMEDFGDEDHPTSGYTIDGIMNHNSEDDFFPMLRSPTMAARRAAIVGSDDAMQPRMRSAGENGETLEDDVFLQISPDFGCLV